jgi:hypothetical protein
MASRTWLDLPVFRATRVKWQRRIFSIILKNRAIFEDRARQLPLLAYKASAPALLPKRFASKIFYTIGADQRFARLCGFSSLAGPSSIPTLMV